MPLQFFVIVKGCGCCVLFGQGHFVITIVNARMTLSANVNALIERLFGEVFFEVGSPMHFLGDKVVECQVAFPLAKRATTLFVFGHNVF